MEGRSFGGSYYSRPPPPPPPASRHPMQGWSYSNPGSLPPYPPPRPMSGAKSPYIQGFASPLVGLGSDVLSRMPPSLPQQGVKSDPNSRAVTSDWPTTPREDWTVHGLYSHAFAPQGNQLHVQAHQSHVAIHQPHTHNHQNQNYFRSQAEYSRVESSLQSYMSPSTSLSATFDALQIEERRQENSPSQPSSSNQIGVSNVSRSARLAQQVKLISAFNDAISVTFLHMEQRAYQELARMASLAAEEEENGPLYLGVGINLRDYEHRIIISFIAAGSVAAQSGLLSEGDQIRMIDHTLVDGLSAQNVEDMLIGEEGSVVIITVLKPGEDGFTHATLVRKSSLREREECARKKKEIYDVGINLSVSEQRDVRIVELIAGGPAAKLGYVNVGDSVVAIDEQPIPSDIPVSDLHAFVLSRVCGPKGTSVVLSLLKAGIGMRYHVQLRRTNLFGAASLRPKSESMLSMASTEASSAVAGSCDERSGGPHGPDVDVWSQQLSGYGDDTNPVPLWKAAHWRPQLHHEVADELQRAVTNCLTLGGGCFCYGIGLIPNQQGEAWVQVGDVLVDLGGTSLRGAPFHHVAAALRSSERRASGLTVGLYRPSARAVVHARLDSPDPPPDPPTLLRL